MSLFSICRMTLWKRTRCYRNRRSVSDDLISLSLLADGSLVFYEG